MRNQDVVDSALKALTDAAGTEGNLFPLVLHAVKSYCSVGEIMNALKTEFGTWMAPSGF
jgi:methylmalonyl-CoA mutase N-terminal domain/subunit